MKSNELNIVSPAEAVACVKSGNRIFFHGAAMTPNVLINALCERYQELQEVELIQIHTEGNARYTQAPYREAFITNSCFVGSNVREAANSAYGAYIPIFLSEVHLLFRKNILPLDVAFIQVSPPDSHGFCSLGVSVDITLPAVQTAKKIIAQINPNVPRTHGDGIIHMSKIDAAIEVDEPIHSHALTTPTEIERQIGKHVAELIEDGATLQMGIGGIPNVVLSNLMNHKRLGIHTELFSDGILPLVEKGIITGEEKQIKTGKIVTCFAM